MFDVAWTEPVETVGQRKTRKDKQSNRLSQGSSVLTSKSSDSSSSPPQSQTRPSLFGLFSHNKKGTLQRSGSTSKLSTIRSENTSKASKRISTYTTASDSSSQELSGAKTIATRIPPNSCSDDGRQSNTETEISSPSDESIFSGWTARSSAATESSWGSNFTSRKREHVQPLSRNSYITQSTEVTISPRGSINEDEQIATVVRISSAGTIPIKVLDSPSNKSPTTSTLEFPIPKLSITDESTTHPSPTGSAKTDIVFRSREPQSDSWRPPEAWQCPSTKVETPKSPLPKSPRRPKDRKAKSRTSELTHLQKNIRKMDAASSKIILERLKEEWIGVADASIYRELELERQLWMLAALRALQADDTSGRGSQSVRAAAVASRKVLSLYENKASSSFLSASNPILEIHHLSTSPLLPKHYPNVRPLAVPGPSAQLPYASNIFAHIHAFSLPAILPASSIPALLKECHRTLVSAHSIASPAVSPTTPSFPKQSKAGSLHLTILDPSPIPSTLGPLLRAWLDTHLIVNLERQFRCINPARLFPIWLADAGLRAEGSTIADVRFLASASHDPDGFSIIDGTGQEQGIVSAECTKQELRCMVGRMLWKEMWGPFVEGEKWWWEDALVVEECERVGTCWEYAVIEAVKEG